MSRPNEPLRIMHIAPTPFFSDRGCHIRIMGEVRALSEIGCDIRVATYHIGRDIDGITTVRTPRIPWYQNTGVGFSWHKLYLDILLFYRCCRLYRSFRPHILHAHLHEGAVIGSIVQRLFGKVTPLVFDMQGSLAGEMAAYGTVRHGSRMWRILAEIERRILRLPQHILCSSEKNLHMLCQETRAVPERCSLALDGISPDFFQKNDTSQLRRKLNLPEKATVIVYAGSLLPAKGICHLLKAMQRIFATCQHCYLLLIGFPETPCRLESEKLALDPNRIRMTGKLDFFSLSSYLAIADVAVDPKATDAGEASGKIINYMGAGLPVACFDSAQNRLLLQDAGFYATAVTSSSLADAIQSAMGAAGKAAGERGRGRAQRSFTWRHTASHIFKIYRTLIQKETT